MLQGEYCLNKSILEKKKQLNDKNIYFSITIVLMFLTMFMVFSSFKKKILLEGQENEYAIEPAVENRNRTTCIQALNLSRNEKFDILLKSIIIIIDGDHSIITISIFIVYWQVLS